MYFIQNQGTCGFIAPLVSMPLVKVFTDTSGSVTPSIYVLFGCSVAKEGTGRKKIPWAITLNYCHINNWMDTCRVTQRCFHADVGCSAGQMLCCLRLLPQIRRAYDKWFRSQHRKHLEAKWYSSVVWSHWWVLNMILKALCSDWKDKEEKVH